LPVPYPETPPTTSLEGVADPYLPAGPVEPSKFRSRKVAGSQKNTHTEYVIRVTVYE
jgi:hypothetical protein